MLRILSSWLGLIFFFFSQQTDCLENIHGAVNENTCENNRWQSGNGKSNHGMFRNPSGRRAAGLATTGAKKKIHLVQSSFYGILSFKGLLCPEKQRKTVLFLEDIFWVNKFAQPEGLRNEILNGVGGSKYGESLSSPFWPPWRSLTNGQDIKWENVVGFADFL